MLPIPMTRGGDGLQIPGYQFPPPCYDASGADKSPLRQGVCSGEWMNNSELTSNAPVACDVLSGSDRMRVITVTMYDSLKVPEVKPGEYVLGFRWDCESSAQVWQSCADITITA